MASDLVISLIARDRMSETFDHAGRAADRSASRMSKFGALAAKAGKAAAIGLAVGAGAAAIALVDMTKGAIEDQAAADKLAKALKNTAGATDGQVASIEKWISAQGIALGVTDDQLRPALEKLVGATHDVGEAQRLSSLAMDISAATGKSLESVSLALAKGYNGQVAGLAKYGVKMKNAAGETVSFKEATKRLGDTFAGQAATKANTLQGKMDRLKVIFDETKESIGAKLIPVVTKLADWFLNKGLPAIERFIGQMKSGEGAGGQFASVLRTIGNAVATAAKFLNNHREIVVGVIAAYVAWKVTTLAMAAAEAASLVWLKLHTVGTVENTVATKAAAVASKVWAAAQWVLNAAIWSSPVTWIVVGIVALIAVIVLVATKTNFFQTVWKKTWSFLKAVGSWIGSAFVKVWHAAGDAISWITKKANQVMGWLKSNWPKILAILTGPVGIAALLIAKNWDRIKAGASAMLHAVTGFLSNLGRTFMSWAGTVGRAVGKAIKFVLGIQPKIIRAFAGAIGWLVAAGNAIVQGLWNGIKTKVSQLLDYIGGVASSIKDKFGDVLEIFSPSRVFRRFGQYLIEGLIKGIGDMENPLGTVLDRLGNFIDAKASRISDLISKRNEVVSSLQGFTESVFAHDFSNGEGGAPTTVAEILAFQKRERSKAMRLKRDVDRVRKLGLSDDLIQQFINSGESGAQALHALAQGSAGQIAQLNRQNAGTKSALAGAGMSLGNELYGDQIAEARRQEALARRIEAAIHAGMKGLKLELHAGGSKLDDMLIHIIRNSVRSRGGNVQLVLGPKGSG